METMSMENMPKAANVRPALAQKALENKTPAQLLGGLCNILEGEVGMSYPKVDTFGTAGPTVVSLTLPDWYESYGEDKIMYLLGVASVKRANDVAKASKIWTELEKLDKGNDTFAHVITSYGGDQPDDSILSDHPLMLYTMDGFTKKLEEYKANDEVSGLVYPYIICHQRHTGNICEKLNKYSNIGFLLSVSFAPPKGN